MYVFVLGAILICVVVFYIMNRREACPYGNACIKCQEDCLLEERRMNVGRDTTRQNN